MCITSVGDFSTGENEGYDCPKMFCTFFSKKVKHIQDALFCYINASYVCGDRSHTILQVM